MCVYFRELTLAADDKKKKLTSAVNSSLVSKVFVIL